jgi:tripartite-type tricarboxylate transporter receptor subunit TctC
VPDAPRLLHRHSPHGYTDQLAHSLFQEPEAVSADDQQRLTAAAHQAAKDAQVSEWQERRARIQREFDWLYSQRFRRDVRSQLRAVQRQLERLDQRIAG